MVALAASASHPNIGRLIVNPIAGAAIIKGRIVNHFFIKSLINAIQEDRILGSLSLKNWVGAHSMIPSHSWRLIPMMRQMKNTLRTSSTLRIVYPFLIKRVLRPPLKITLHPGNRV